MTPITLSVVLTEDPALHADTQQLETALSQQEEAEWELLCLPQAPFRQLLDTARGDYCYFVRPGGVCTPEHLLQAAKMAAQKQADVAVLNTPGHAANVEAATLSAPGRVPPYQAPPPALWNRLFRRDFLLSLPGVLSPGDLAADMTLALFAAFRAERILSLPVPLEAAPPLFPDGLLQDGAGEQLARQVAGRLEDAGWDGPAGIQFDLLAQIYDPLASAPDAPEAAGCYRRLHQLFSAGEPLRREDFTQDISYLTYLAIRKHSLSEMEALERPRLLVSMTSYPARIHCVAPTMERLWDQTKQADQVLLYLAKSQFPGLEGDLPEELLTLRQSCPFQICWCDEDLKPHKKYYYAMQAYPDDVIVTVDDDLVYPSTLLEQLYRTYLVFPHAVSANRTHLIPIDEGGDLLPYHLWPMETDACLYQPSLQLLATGVAGILYPPHLLPELTFHREGILSTCLEADDLWLKAMELIHAVPVVLSHPHQKLQNIPGSQEVALYKQNIDQNRNDQQLARIMEWLEGRYPPRFLQQQLLRQDVGTPLLGIEALCRHFSSERSLLKDNTRAANSKLRRSQREASNLNTRLKRTYQEKSQLSAQLRQANREKSAMDAKLQKAAHENDRLKEKVEKLTGKWEKSRAANQSLKERNAALKASLAEERQKLKRLKASPAYKLGRILTWPFRKLAALFRKGDAK